MMSHVKVSSLDRSSQQDQDRKISGDVNNVQLSEL
jgi:hypothetical protein